MSRPGTWQMKKAASQPFIDKVIEMEKVEPGILRELLDKIIDLDTKYAEGVRNRVMVPIDDVRGTGDTLRNLVGAIAGAPLLKGLPPIENVPPRLIDRAAQYGVPAASAGIRYGIPLAAASTLANATGDFYDYISEYGEA